MTDEEKIRSLELRVELLEKFAVEVCPALIELTTADLIAVRIGLGENSLDELKKAHADIHAVAKNLIKDRAPHGS